MLGLGETVESWVAHVDVSGETRGWSLGSLLAGARRDTVGWGVLLGYLFTDG